MNTFPIEGDKIPEGYSGWLLFLDEMNSAPLAVQSAAYKLVLDRMVGQHNLHPNVAIVAAGNKEDDGAITNTISTALQSRMAWLELVVDTEEWLDWAYGRSIHHRITDFVKFKPSALYTFSPDHTDKTYASPRTWEFATRLMEYEGEDDFLPLMAGTLSEGVAREFVVFCRIYDSLPKLVDIEASPETVNVPDEPSILFALTGSIANSVKPESFNTIVKYIQRMPEEFQVITMREIVQRNKAMLSHEGMRKWMVILPM